jgi:hypothetical protein
MPLAARGLICRQNPTILPGLANSTSGGRAIAWLTGPPISPTGTFSTPDKPRRATMNSDPVRLSLLEELDTRQNELLDELDKLNHRIEQILRTCLPCQPQPQLVKVTAS